MSKLKSWYGSLMDLTRKEEKDKPSISFSSNQDLSVSSVDIWNLPDLKVVESPKNLKKSKVEKNEDKQKLSTSLVNVHRVPTFRQPSIKRSTQSMTAKKDASFILERKITTIFDETIDDSLEEVDANAINWAEKCLGNGQIKLHK